MKYISEKYIKNKYITEVGITNALNGAENFLGSHANLIGIGTMVLPAISAVVSGIKQKMLQAKWRIQGCAKEFEPNRKIECEIRERNRLIADLTKDRNKCTKTKDPAKCMAKYDEKIEMLRQKNNNAYGSE